MIAPCKDCPDRSPKCHDKCQVYREWSAQRKAANAAASHDARMKQIVGTIHAIGVERARKGAGRKWTST